MTETECRAVEAVDAEALLDSLRRLVEVPSVTGVEGGAQVAVAGQMRDRGMDVDVWPLDLAELSRHPAYGAEVERSEALGVVGTFGCHEGGRTLVLNGHIDVVSAGDAGSWRESPWSGRLEDGWVHGRGTADMKGGLAAALAAVKAIRDAGVRLRGRVFLQSVVGEEDGGIGTLASILRGYRGQGAVVMEPTALAVMPCHAGSVSFRIAIRGRAAHGALRLEGVSAVEKFIPMLAAIQALEARRNERVQDPIFAEHRLPCPISVGRVEAGNWASTVPESLVFEGRYGVMPGERIDDARRELDQAVADAAATDPWLRRNPPEVEWWGGTFAPASTSLDHPIAVTVREAARAVIGVEPALGAMTAGTDLRLLVNEGNTPGVLFGPGDLRRAHAPDEAVPLEEVVTVARVLTLTILRFCGYHGD